METLYSTEENKFYIDFEKKNWLNEWHDHLYFLLSVCVSQSDIERCLAVDFLDLEPLERAALTNATIDFFVDYCERKRYYHNNVRALDRWQYRELQRAEEVLHSLVHSRYICRLNDAFATADDAERLLQQEQQHNDTN